MAEEEKSTKSSDYKYGTTDYYHCRVVELENDRDIRSKEAEYYRGQLAKAHEILGRVTHQLSERWGSVNVSEYFPTDNLHRKRSHNNPEGIKK